MKRIFALGALLSFMLLACEPPCNGVNCQNGGVCSDGDCYCPEGFSGDECSIEARADFIGNYITSTECLEYDSFVRITKDNSKGNRVFIENLLDESILVSGTAGNNQIVIDNQSWKGGSVEGFVSVNANILTINVNFTDEDGQLTNCLISGNKQ